MKNRQFGRLGRNVSEIGFGSWGIGGGQWVEVEEDQALAALDAALDLGVTFIDTADVYGDGRSEKLIAKVLKRRGGPRPFIATKLGKRLPSQLVSGYTLENMKSWVQRSLDFLETDALDLVQLHCPPTDLYYHQEVFAALDEIVASGRLKAYGVSVERIEEALKAIEFANVVSVQIIFNILRQRPIDLFFEQARKKNVAIVARVPLASGLLSGKFKPDSQFDKADHRNFNRNGEAFDVGETFSGMPYDKGLEVIERIRPLVGSVSMAQFALRWILMFDAVTVVIPGARTAEQARSNSQAAALPALSPEVMAQLKAIYETDVKPFVHQRW
ncbi:aldo/keto reductase [Mesorhizobium sp. NZP2298]|uniref:aldo/keto reductase n=1 Tax=Mesorhizobium sp. NZP2298 TaxID=2483403 RepID=UPI0015579842|nr:aldo/keto reductase [Mesorhizobium sp. NZP2298]QKC96599.1 aldo/keto reductase [Mesorhizobium sp. NZP2298]